MTIRCSPPTSEVLLLPKNHYPNVGLLSVSKFTLIQSSDPTSVAAPCLAQAVTPKASYRVKQSCIRAITIPDPHPGELGEGSSKTLRRQRFFGISLGVRGEGRVYGIRGGKGSPETECNSGVERLNLKIRIAAKNAIMYGSL